MRLTFWSKFSAVIFTTILLVTHTSAAPLIPADSAATRTWRDSLALEAAGNFPQSAAALDPLPSTYAVSLRRGWLYYLGTNHPTSVTHYRAAIAAAPQSLEARLGLLLPLLAQSQFAEAETEARKILRDHPKNYPARIRLAVALRSQKKFGDAEQLLARTLEHYPGDPALLTELGLAQAAQKKLPEARAAFENALTLDPANDLAFAQFTDPINFSDLAASTGPFSRRVAIAPAPAPRVDASAYGGFLSYERSATKRQATLSGASVFLSVTPTDFFEAGFDHIDISRRNLPHLAQSDITLALSHVASERWRLRLGGHVVTTDDPPTDGGWALFGSADYFVPQRWSAGAHASFTRFPGAPNHLEIFQLSPRVTATLARGRDWNLAAELHGHWIHLGESVAGRSELFSAEARVALGWQRWTFTGFGWTGEQSFALRGGYTLFNLPEKHLRGYGGEVRCELDRRWSVAARYAREEFRESGASATAAGNTLLGTLGFSF